MLSVIVPVYNGEKYITDTLKYICQSTYGDFEIIVVNDGSKDRSEQLILEWAKADQRIRYYYKENGGIVSARNYGLEKAEGKYVCFVDQDDVVQPYMFQLLIADIEHYSADFAQGNVANSEISENVDMESEPFAVLKRNTKEFQDSYGALILRGDVIKTPNKVDCNIWNKIYRTDFLKENHIKFQVFLDYEDDWLFVIETMKYAKTVILRKEVVYIWKINLESESRNRVEKDKYLEQFYEKHCCLRDYLLNALEVISIESRLYRLFEAELQKESLLWGLSNETGRGIENRSFEQSTKLMKEIVKQEKQYGIRQGMVKRPLPISIHGQQGLKKIYYTFRDVFLTILLLNKMEKLAVILNKKVFHGRWHN